MRQEEEPERKENKYHLVDARNDLVAVASVVAEEGGGLTVVVRLKKKEKVRMEKVDGLTGRKGVELEPHNTVKFDLYILKMNKIVGECRGKGEGEQHQQRGRKESFGKVREKILGQAAAQTPDQHDNSK